MSTLVAGATSTSRRDAKASAATWLWPVATAGAASAVVELGVLRVFTRTIIHIPGASSVSPVLSLVAELGRLAYYLTCVLLVATLVLVVAASTISTTRGLMTTTSIGVFGLAAVGARVGVVGDGTVAVVVAATVVVLGTIVAMSGAGLERLPVLLFTWAFAAAAAQALMDGGVAGAGAGGALRSAAEVLAVVAAIASPLALRSRPGRPSIVLGCVVGVLTVAMLMANSSTTTILMLWNLGLAGVLPWVVYGLAAGALTCTLASLLRSADRPGAIAVVLLVAGGIGLHSTYQSGLVIAGLALLGAQRAYGVVGDRDVVRWVGEEPRSMGSSSVLRLPNETDGANLERDGLCEYWSSRMKRPSRT